MIDSFNWQEAMEAKRQCWLQGILTDPDVKRMMLFSKKDLADKMWAELPKWMQAKLNPDNGRAIHCAYQLDKISEPCRFSTILEIGGGLGDMNRTFRCLYGECRTDWITFDLPAVAAIQCLNGVECHHVFNVENISLRDKHMLILGMWSLSEMPVELRARLLDKIREAESAFGMFLFQEQFNGVDNMAWFKRELGQGIAKKIYPHPYWPGSWFWIGDLSQ